MLAHLSCVLATLSNWHFRRLKADPNIPVQKLTMASVLQFALPYSHMVLLSAVGIGIIVHKWDKLEGTLSCA